MAQGSRPNYEFRELIMADDMFRREFGLMSSLVRDVRPGENERLDIVADHIEIVASVFLKHLHGEEMYLLPRLLRRVEDGKKGPIGEVAGRHARIKPQVADLLVELKEWRCHFTDGVRLAVLLDRLVADFEDHAAAQEEFILPLIEEHITAAEWAEMVQQEAGGTPPDSVTLIFGMMMYEGDPDLIETIIRDMPPEVRSVLKQVASQAFTTHAQLVHGTATPPRGKT
jgi:hypothetical protein